MDQTLTCRLALWVLLDLSSVRVLSSSALSAAAASFRLLMCEDADPRPCSLSFTIVLSRVTCAHSQTGNGYCLLGGGFFLTSENSEGRFKDSFPARTSCFLTLFFFKVEISSHTPIPLYGPGSIHSGSASWDDCEQVFPDDLHVSPFSGQASTLCLNSIISPLRHHWVKRFCMLRCYLTPALLAE